MKTKNKKLLTTDEEVAKILVEKQTQYEIQEQKLDKLIERTKQDKYLQWSMSWSVYMLIRVTIFMFLGVWEMIKGWFKGEKD